MLWIMVDFPIEFSYTKYNSSSNYPKFFLAYNLFL